MKISYSNYPSLLKLKTKEFLFINSKKNKLFSDFLIEKYKTEIHNSSIIDDYFKNNINDYNEINIVSSTFMNNVNKCRKKLAELYSTLNDCDKTFNGTFIIEKIIYMFKTEIVNDYVKTSLFQFYQDGIPMLILLSEKNIFFFNNDAFEENSSSTDQTMNVIALLTFICLFKKYAKVETKILTANSKKIINNEKITNETTLQLTYLDSMWFTTIVNSTGFNVNGHFRLQPKKINGEWTKELIYINEFHKNGYSREAKILNQ